MDPVKVLDLLEGLGKNIVDEYPELREIRTMAQAALAREEP